MPLAGSVHNLDPEKLGKRMTGETSGSLEATAVRKSCLLARYWEG